MSLVVGKELRCRRPGERTAPPPCKCHERKGGGSATKLEPQGCCEKTNDRYLMNGNEMTEANRDEDLKILVERLSDRAFDPSCCFLCANHYDAVDLTSEHVFPKWLQNRFDLWNQRFILPNGTAIPYRFMTIPCCNDCNRYRLQPIEVTMSGAVTKGVDAVRKLERNTIFLWLGKIFYGTLYRELSLLLDRTQNDMVTIATPEMLQQYETHLIFLQEVREKVKLVDFIPGSIFTFVCQAPQDARLQWDFCDNIDTMFIAVRMGTVGIVAVLGDGGAQMIFEKAYEPIKDFPLHPLQFREICAHFSYRSSIATRTPKYFVIESSPHEVHQMPLGGFSAKPFFDEWDEDIYGRFLAFYTGYPYEVVHPEQGKTGTWIHDDSGAVRYMAYKEFPYKPQNP